jgi:hypothetical protein
MTIYMVQILMEIINEKPPCGGFSLLLFYLVFPVLKKFIAAFINSAHAVINKAKKALVLISEN